MTGPILAACFVASAVAFFLWTLRHDGKRYFIRPMKPDAWGTRFEIVAPDGKVVGFDWYAVARQRCRALNLELEATRRI